MIGATLLINSSFEKGTKSTIIIPKEKDGNNENNPC